MPFHRKFEVSLVLGEGNTKHVESSYTKMTPFDAFNAFCFDNQCIGYPLRRECPEQRNDGLFAVWSGGCSISGQRIYVRERIGA